jgi:hypothetical protein
LLRTRSIRWPRSVPRSSMSAPSSSETRAAVPARPRDRRRGPAAPGHHLVSSIGARGCREFAGGRGDLLVHVAGIELGFHEDEPGEPLSRQVAALCRDAGADESWISEWIAIGRQRRAGARRLPFSGGLRGRARPDAKERRDALCPALIQLCFRLAGQRATGESGGQRYVLRI